MNEYIPEAKRTEITAVNKPLTAQDLVILARELARNPRDYSTETGRMVKRYPLRPITVQSAGTIGSQTN